MAASSCRRASNGAKRRRRGVTSSVAAARAGWRPSRPARPPRGCTRGHRQSRRGRDHRHRTVPHHRTVRSGSAWSHGRPSRCRPSGLPKPNGWRGGDASGGLTRRRGRRRGPPAPRLRRRRAARRSGSCAPTGPANGSRSPCESRRPFPHPQRRQILAWPCYQHTVSLFWHPTVTYL